MPPFTGNVAISTPAHYKDIAHVDLHCAIGTVKLGIWKLYLCMWKEVPGFTEDMLLKMQQVMSAQSRASIQMPELLESTNSIDT